MKAIIALEELIKQEEAKLKFAKKQLADHENGTTKLTRVAIASTEETIEVNQELLNKHKAMLDELLKQDIKELEEKERIKEAIKRKNYFKYQKVRLKRDTIKSNDEKIEAMLIVDELPESIHIEDQEIFEVACKSLELHLTIHEEIAQDYKDIKEELEKLTKDIKGEDIKELELLNIRIIILVVQFRTLLLNIKQNIEEENLPPFKGFPRFEDWWIEELWTNHQAYFGLYKWHKIVEKLCLSSDQKRAWKIIFANWISVKKIISQKGALGFEYNFAFDALMRKYAELEEEFELSNLESMEKIIEQLLQKEDLLAHTTDHKLITNYLEYKINKLKEKN
jgi:hypothetical protein